MVFADGQKTPIDSTYIFSESTLEYASVKEKRSPFSKFGWTHGLLIIVIDPWT
jgi:hypothetical protein